MSKNRFILRRKLTGHRIYDTKTDEPFDNIIADDITLREICRVFNALNTKNEIMAERVDQQCDLIKQLKRELKEHDSK